MTHNQLEAIAYHEAGHAVVAFFLFTGIRKKAASIVADEDALDFLEQTQRGV